MQDGTCSLISPQLDQWLLIEITTFYAFILSGIAYLGLAALFGYKRKDLSKDTHASEKAVDFLEKTEEVYQQFGLVTTQLIVTVAVQIIDGRTDCLGDTSY